MSLPPAGPEPRQNRDISSLSEQMQTKAVALIILTAKVGIPLLVVEALRTEERQAWLYSIGRTHSHPVTGSEKIVTKAPPGSSNHEGGNAIDVVPVIRINGKAVADWNSSLWEVVGQIGESLGLSWGGRFVTLHDQPHFEYKP